MEYMSKCFILQKWFGLSGQSNRKLLARRLEIHKIRSPFVLRNVVRRYLSRFRFIYTRAVTDSCDSSASTRNKLGAMKNRHIICSIYGILKLQGFLEELCNSITLARDFAQYFTVEAFGQRVQGPARPISLHYSFSGAI